MLQRVLCLNISIGKLFESCSIRSSWVIAVRGIHLTIIYLKPVAELAGQECLLHEVKEIDNTNTAIIRIAIFTLKFFMIYILRRWIQLSKPFRIRVGWTSLPMTRRQWNSQHKRSHHEEKHQGFNFFYWIHCFYKYFVTKLTNLMFIQSLIF